MSVTVLQQRIREKKTPLALGLRPELDKLSPKILKNFTDMFGPGAMADAEALRYHGTMLLDAAAEKLPAVMLHGASYLRYGMMGADVLANLVSAAHAKGLYVILGMGAEAPALWQSYGADAITVDPYMGSDCCDAGEQAPFVLVRTCNKSGGEVQSLMAGDRPLYLAVAEQMARRGASLVVGSGYSLDIRDVRRLCPKSFLLLPECDGENAVPAFDEYGHGAMTVDFDLQFAPDAAAAVDSTVREMKQWVTVV